MKQIFISLAFLFSLCCTAQIETRSSLDANSDGSITTADVDGTKDGVLGKLTDETRVVTTGNSYATLTALSQKLSALQDKLKTLEKMGIYNYSNYINGHECVDLGLSVKWATCNVGALTPEDYGLYFAWGDTVGYTSNVKDHVFDWTTYTLCSEKTEKSLTKYCNNSEYGKEDNLTTLELVDDAAHAKWGGSWRMPTDDELKELTENCTWTWITQKGVNGFKVTSKKDGYTDKSIFLPAAGVCQNGVYGCSGTHANYRSSSLYTDDCRRSLYLYFDFKGTIDYASNYYRCFGRSVRAVCK